MVKTKIRHTNELNGHFIDTSSPKEARGFVKLVEESDVTISDGNTGTYKVVDTHYLIEGGDSYLEIIVE